MSRLLCLLHILPQGSYKMLQRLVWIVVLISTPIFLKYLLSIFKYYSRFLLRDAIFVIYHMCFNGTSLTVIKFFFICLNRPSFFFYLLSIRVFFFLNRSTDTILPYFHIASLMYHSLGRCCMLTTTWSGT